MLQTDIRQKIPDRHESVALAGQKTYPQEWALRPLAFSTVQPMLSSSTSADSISLVGCFGRGNK